jgi:hypothetical protein
MTNVAEVTRRYALTCESCGGAFTALVPFANTCSKRCKGRLRRSRSNSSMQGAPP